MSTILQKMDLSQPSAPPRFVAQLHKLTLGISSKKSYNTTLQYRIAMVNL